MSDQDYLRLYEQLGIQVDRKTEHEIQAKCPFHSDQTASLSINVGTGLFKCFAASCGKGGNLEKFLQLLEEVDLKIHIDPKVITDKHAALLAQPEALRWCYEERGLTHETIVKYRLGWEPGRLWIPITDERGKYVNIRRHSMAGKTRYGKTLSFRVGYGQVRLWPPPLGYRANTTLWFCEGELDCLVLLQQGLNAFTTTGGADAWKDSWANDLRAFHFNLVYDTDEAGLRGAQKIGHKLLPVAASVRILRLPLQPPLKDVTDFFVKAKKTLDDLIDEEGKTKPLTLVPVIERDKTVHEVPLHEAGRQEMVGKLVKTKVVVAGKDLAPFAAPKDMRFTCRMGLRICQNCSIARNNGTMQVSLPPDEPGLLTLINVSDVMQKMNIRKLVGIVPSCPRFDWEVMNFHNLEELKLLPDIDYTPDTHAEYVIRQAYYVGDGIRTNQPYEAEGIVVPHPANQYVTFLLPKMKPTKSSIQAYQVTPESVERLAIFQPRSAGIMERWKDISADLTANVTHIYQREDLIYAVDLVLHSVLGFTFQGQPVQRGWTEGLIVGDTRCGKSETVKALVQHYRMGEIITGESVSFAGLVGGLQQTQKRWSITWGKIPLNDRRALVIDEVSGMPLSDIERMSGIRSSGIAELTKVQTERTLARCRMLWVSNPRAARPVNTYDSGAQVIKELIGKPEDIARFDLAIIVSTSEVPLNVINQRPTTKLTHRFTTELSHELLLWIWSRTRDQVVFEEEATTACLELANQFATMYSSELPLVEPNEQRIKFARLGAAVAGRFFSTDETGTKLIVKAEHVHVAAQLLQRWYNNTNFNYRFYSEIKLKEVDLTTEDALIVKNIIYPLGLKFCQALLGFSYLKLVDLEDLTGRERKDARLILGTLVQCGALKRKAYGYVKTPGFIKLLREMKQEDIPRLPEI